MDLLSRQDMLALADKNRGTQYTTEELWEDDHQYVVVNRNGYLVWDNGEEIIDENEELPEDDWFEVTGYEEDPFLEDVSEDEINGGYYSDYDSPLYDENDY